MRAQSGVMRMKKIAMMLLMIQTSLLAQNRTVEPTWLHRNVSTLREHQTDLSSSSCHYTAIFGEGDAESRFPLSIARFGKLTVDPHGTCKEVVYPRQEELYFVQEGRGALHYGEESRALASNDFTYLAPAVRHSISNPSNEALRLVITTVRIPSETSMAQPGKLLVANLEELQEQTVTGHPNSVLYKLMIGPRPDDRISIGYTVIDFFMMDL